MVDQTRQSASISCYAGAGTYTIVLCSGREKFFELSDLRDETHGSQPKGAAGNGCASHYGKEKT